MSTETTYSTRFTIDFFGKSIIGTKASFNKAGKGSGHEYEELTAKIAAHPDFKLVVKEQKHKTAKAKRTYEGLDFDFMENYIEIQENAKDIMDEYTAVKAMAKACGTKTYPLTKKWFLAKFDGFDMSEAAAAISQYLIDKAVSGISRSNDNQAAEAKNERPTVAA